MPIPDMTKEETASVVEFFRQAGYEPTETNIKQFAVLMDAFQIFMDRNAKRADLWRQFGWQDSALHIRSKAARVALTLERDLDIDPADVLDDAFDLINVAAFFIRNVLDPA